LYIDTLELELEAGALGTMNTLVIEFEFAPELADQASTIFGAEKQVRTATTSSC
jgi:hypothetical protein